mgnify:CR=1 FL=1
MTTRALISCSITYVVIGLGSALLGGAAESYGREEKGQLRAQGKEICQEVQSGKMWQVDKKSKFSSAREAERYAADLQLGGYGDWRLPTKAEMFNLARVFFWKKNADCTMNMRGDFWLVDDRGKTSPGHWEFEYACGPQSRFIKAIQPKGYVRAVRP